MNQVTLQKIPWSGLWAHERESNKSALSNQGYNVSRKCNFKLSSSHIKSWKKKMKFILTIYIYLTQHIKIRFQQVVHTKHSSWVILHSLFQPKSLKPAKYRAFPAHLFSAKSHFKLPHVAVVTRVGRPSSKCPNRLRAKQDPCGGWISEIRKD